MREQDRATAQIEAGKQQHADFLRRRDAALAAVTIVPGQCVQLPAAVRALAVEEAAHDGAAGCEGGRAALDERLPRQDAAAVCLVPVHGVW
jgi:hypothetical protein